MPPCLLYLFPPTPLWPLFWKICSVPWRIAASSWKIKLTWANVPCSMQSGQLPTPRSVMTNLCGAKSSYSSLDLYHSHIPRAHTYTDIRTYEHACTCRHTTRVCAFSKPDFPVGWSVIGRLFKGKVWAKKCWLWGYYGNSLPRGVGCLLNCALVC